MTTAAAPRLSLSEARSDSAKWQVLVGALMVQLILGTVYGYSVFWQPLESHLWPAVVTEIEAASMQTAGQALPAGAVIVADAAAVANEHATRQGYLKYAFAICLLAFAGAMVFAGRMQDIKGPRLTAILGGVLLAVAFLIAGQMDSIVEGVNGRLILLWATTGLVAGIGIGCAYVCPIAALVKWFPEHKGLVSGLAVAGFGLGALVFSGKSVVGAVGFIEAHGIVTFFSVHAMICAVVVIIGALLLRNPPTPATALASAVTTGVQDDITWQQLLRQGRFRTVWLMFFSGAMAGLMVIGILKPFAGNQLVAAAEGAGTAVTETLRSQLLLRGATAVGILAIFNAVGRVVWGFVSDKLGRTPAMALMFTLQGTTLLLLSTLDTELQLAVGAACVGFNFGGNFALFPSLTADLFGSRNFGANYGWVFTSYGVAGVTGVWVGNIARQLTNSYFVAFAVAALLCFVSAILALALSRRGAATA